MAVISNEGWCVFRYLCPPASYWNHWWHHTDTCKVQLLLDQDHLSRFLRNNWCDKTLNKIHELAPSSYSQSNQQESFLVAPPVLGPDTLSHVTSITSTYTHSIWSIRVSSCCSSQVCTLVLTIIRSSVFLTLSNCTRSLLILSPSNNQCPYMELTVCTPSPVTNVDPHENWVHSKVPMNVQYVLLLPNIHRITSFSGHFFIYFTDTLTVARFRRFCLRNLPRSKSHNVEWSRRWSLSLLQNGKKGLRNPRICRLGCDLFR